MLYETAGGYSLFRVKDAAKVAGASKGDVDLAAEVERDPGGVVELLTFEKFGDVEAATAGAAALVEGSLHESLRTFLTANLRGTKDKLLVADHKLGLAIKQALKIECIASESDRANAELLRAIRGNQSALVPGLSEADASQYSMSLAHSLSRYKVKFSPDKIDTMIVQAIGLLDELDKEINTYSMRVREWYGWHFPEMAKIVAEGLAYAKTVKRVGMRVNARDAELDDIIEDERLRQALRDAATTSMGTDISEDDLRRIQALCDEVIEMTSYRGQLFDYLKNRMHAIAPNLTHIVGELVGARLIAHAGSLLNLAKAPASTVQIFGAEKALFRALKTKHDTPKYGLLFHASLIGQAQPKNKGRIARVLASKASLATRVDALGDSADAQPAIEWRLQAEARLRQFETNEPYRLQPAAHAQSEPRSKTTGGGYRDATDATAVVAAAAASSASRKRRASSADVDGEEVIAKVSKASAGAESEDDDDEKTRKKAKKAAKKAKKRRGDEFVGAVGEEDDA